jgi:hypothetical protein
VAIVAVIYGIVRWRRRDASGAAQIV